jgi:serine/threonine protein kinase/class 3 adenylate cyclase
MAELKTFLFTDISGSVRLKDEMAGRSVTERDQAFIHTILTPHRQRIENRLAEFGGRVVSTAGDGHFLVFDHTIQAAQWAASVQESHEGDPIATPRGDSVTVRMSMHVGVPQIDPGDPDNFVGKTVDYAARLNDYATGGQILVSRSVMAILDDVGLEGIRLYMHGRRLLKGIGNVEVHELLYDDRGPRPLRNQPKTITERQWTVVPAHGGEAAGGGTGVSLADAATLKRVGNYELEGVIGSGGMGDVYKARHMQFGRLRAVKVIKPQFMTAGHTEVVRRFYNEIKAVGRLEHKNIVVAIDSSSPTDQVHYLVMEYIDGLSLDELVSLHGPLPIPEACEIVRQAARGLQYIYKHDMVHRDLKPSNIMVTLVEGDQAASDSTFTHGEGERAVVKILDLGLALLAADQHDRLTRLEHQAMGTGMYMPPEQWKTTTVDIRADVYSLGCTLYHLLAGNPPFYDSDLRPEKAHEKSAVPPIRSYLHPLPKKLWDVIRTMLEKRPEDRYSTPAEVSAALAPFAEGHQLPALIRAQQGSTPAADGSTTPTRSNGLSKADTWRSRPWFSGGSFARNRQYILNRLVPIALMALFTGGAVWLLYASHAAADREAEAERLRVERQVQAGARDVLSSFAKTAAATVARELDKRFTILAKEAADPELIKLVGRLNAQPDDKAAQDELQAWVRKLPDEYGKELKVESWFVQDVRGTQIARTPKDSASYMKPYWFRDYFHGAGKDRDETDESVRAETRPIEDNHLSSVYYSTTTKLLKVAFSVPIRGDRSGAAAAASATAAAAGDGDGKVIGVLAMSINLQDFTVLDPEQAAGSEVLLVDLRPDWIKGENHGLVLHGPRLAAGQLARIDGELLAQIDRARPLSDPEFNGADHFLAGYDDPLTADDGQKYWGAFEPVRYQISTHEGEGRGERFGWVVLVQRPMPAAGPAAAASK